MAEVHVDVHSNPGGGIIGAGTITAGQIIFYNFPLPITEPSSDVGEIGACPYKGLLSFRPEDAPRFFGRHDAIADLMTAVDRQSLTALVGASGSGKSSVVLAGLAPCLHHGGGWLFSYFRIGNEPDSDPFLALSRALVPLYVTSLNETEQLVNTRRLAEALRSGKLMLRDVFAQCRSQSQGSRILLIADQFEEAFTLVKDDPTRNQFIDVLLAGFSDPTPERRPDISLVLTLRGDFYGRALLYRRLTDALQGHVENLGPMNREELRAAIVRPAEDTRVSFEPGLVETLLDKVEDKPGSLPLLQFALREMWGKQERRVITRTAYEDTGGVERALARRADRIFTDLTANGTNAEITRNFQRLFTRLVILGEGQEDTRRVADRDELGAEAWSLAQRLAEADNRLVVTNATESSHETAEVVHEALIRNWPKLASWIDRDRAFLSWLRQIKSNMELWSSAPSDDGPLLRGGMLAQATDWLARREDDLSKAERSFIKASVALHRRAKRRRSATAWSGAIVGLVLTIWIAWDWHSAAIERDKARAQLLGIQARRAVANVTSADDIERAAALALESIATSGNRPGGTDAIEAAMIALPLLPIRVFPRTSSITSLAVLTNGWLASGGYDGTIRLWPTEANGKSVFFRHGTERVTSLAVLADGRLASGGRDGTIKVWPVKGDAIVLRQGSEVTSLTVLTDGRLVSGGGDGTIKIWSKDGEGEPVVLRHGSSITSLAVLRDGRLGSAGHDGSIKLWAKQGGTEPVATLQGRWVTSLAALPDGRLASGSGDGTIKVWSKAGKEEPALRKQDSRITSLTVLTDGRMASGGADGTVRIWPKESRGEPATLPQGSRVTSLTVLADGRLTSGGINGVIKLWPKEGKSEPVVLAQHNSEVTSLAVLDDGRLASGGGGMVKLWPKDDRGEPVTLSRGDPFRSPTVTSLAVLPDGRLASGDRDGTISIWPKRAQGKPVTLFHSDPIRSAPVTSMAVLADGRLVSGDEDGAIKIWPKNGEGEPIVLDAYGPTFLAVLADGRLASGSSSGILKIWPRGGNGESVIVSQYEGEIRSLAVLPDGRLASGGERGKIKVWPKDGNTEPVVLPHGSPVTSLTVLADGRLASGGEDGTIKLWPKDGNGEPIVLPHGSPVTSLTVLVDGRLVSGDGEGTIKLSLVDQKQLIAALCLRAGRNLTKDEWARYIGSDTTWEPACRRLGLPSNWRTVESST